MSIHGHDISVLSGGGYLDLHGVWVIAITGTSELLILWHLPGRSRQAHINSLITHLPSPHYSAPPRAAPSCLLPQTQRHRSNRPLHPFVIGSFSNKPHVMIRSRLCDRSSVLAKARFVFRFKFGKLTGFGEKDAHLCRTICIL